MTRALDNLRQITTFLMMNNTSPTKGFTAGEIADAVPDLKERTVYRIVSSNPQFVQTQNSIHPKRYYFDPLKVKVVREATGPLQIRPELAVSDKPLMLTLQGLLDGTKGEDNQLRREIVTIAKAANNALAFQVNKEALNPSLWEAAKYSVENLEQFAAALYQRMYAIRNDERYNSPEWWAMFTKEQG